MSDERTPTGGRGHRVRGAALLAALVLSAVAASAAASAAIGQDAPDPLEQQMEAEIEAMVDAGVPPDHRKVEMLEEELEELEEGGGADPPPEPGVDVEEMIEDAEQAEAREDAGLAPPEGHLAVAPPGQPPRTVDLP